MKKFVESVQRGRTRWNNFSLVLLAILLLVGSQQATGTAKKKPRLGVGAPKPSSGRTLTVSNISVTQGPQGMDLEIQANGPLSPQTMIVENPERLVIDLPGSLPVRARKLEVNALKVKSVRMARYRDYPPTTRVVVDLLAARDYQVLAEGNTVHVKLRDPVLASIPTSTPTLAPVRAASQLATEIATQPTSTSASAEPNPAAGSTSDVATQPLTDSVAASAAMPEIPASSPPGSTAKQVEPNPPPDPPVTVASTPSSSNTPAPPAGAAPAAVATEGKPTLRVGALPEHSVTLDGVLTEPVWAAADAITNLVTIEPEQGGKSAGQTIVKVLGNSHEIIIGVVCHDPDPAKIVSFSKARDAELENEDHITIVLDTFLDGRTGYVFAVNPSGARFDGLVSPQGGEVNSDWDAVWEASTSRDNGGWSAEIKIPIHSLRFKRGLSGWGLNVERRVERLQETSRWAGLKRDYEISQTSQAGILTDLPHFDLGLGLSIRPAFTPRSEKTAGQKTRLTSDVSLDVTKTLGSNLLTSLTINTDFAETEVDTRQTNLTRFELLFPEKRTFFLEGADVFEFGLGLDESMVPFFSRRIGLFSGEDGGEGVEIPLAAGGKLNGQVGNTSLGALVVRTRSLDGLGVPAATMGAVRIKQNILSESSVGVIATVGDQLGRPGSWLTGVDFTYRNSHFLEDKNLQIGIWGLVNGRDGLAGNKSAYGFEIDYPNDRWDVTFSSKRIGDGFDPSLGFVPRRGVHTWDGGVEFNPRPEWSFVRQMFHQLSWSVVTDLGFDLESYAFKLKPVDWLLESGDRFQFEVVREGDRPGEDFDVFETEDKTVTIPEGTYQWTRYNLQGTLAEKRKISGGLVWEFGGFYGGNLDTIEAKLAFNWPLFKVEVGGERNIGRLPHGRFTQNLYSSRVELRFSPKLQVSSLLQYDNESGSIGTNTRLRWTFKPLGDLFIVYNHNLLRSVSDGSRRWNFDSNKLVVKLQYAFRF